MSKDKALHLIDELLSILDKADHKTQTCPSKSHEHSAHSHDHSAHTHEHSDKCEHSHATKQTSPVKEDNFDWNYLTGVKDSYAGKNFRVTKDIKLLEQEWKSSDLGPNDELQDFCGCVGLCIQVEEDDNTLQLRWENMDTCWMPAKCCALATNLKPTIPRHTGDADWLPPPGLEQYRDDEKQEKIEPEELFESVEDENVKKGKICQVTRDLNKLQQAWKDSELGPNDDLKPYCGAIGQIMDVEEDDDTVQIRWANLDTCWIPVKALQPAEGKQLTIPNSAADWLTPEGLKEEQGDESGNAEQTNATDEYYKQKQAESEAQ